MRKAAFAYWDNRLAPVFDSARQLYLVEVDTRGIALETQEMLPDDQPAQKALRLAELTVDTLVCGAISRSLHEMVSAYGIRVIPFVAGELREIILAWQSGNLQEDAFAMPGCRRQRRSLRKCGLQSRSNLP
ncbi:MAG: NifB/NifX family molybdenum-iron cluster-binding protein [Proteobacteria bacterium]|nr:NifB/NifX family molybdenum-iron cluster-binding protein [Pseudomonadota bacterium]